jgi:hypothetical protein
MALLKFVLIVITIYYLVKLLFPYAVRFFFRRLEKKMRQASQNQSPVNKPTKKASKSSKKVGEYIDFEEIE